MFMTTARSSSERPVASDSAFSISSWMRRTCASTSIVRSYGSGSGVICARIDVPTRVTTSARTRAIPSMMMLMPPCVLAICRTTATVPILRTSSGVGIVGVVLLKQEQDQAIRAERAVDRLNRNGPVHRQRLQRQRKRDRAAKGKNREFLWQGRRGRLSHRANLSLS